MSGHEQSRPKGRNTLSLTKWEVGNLHLPPVTTVTLYEGAAPVEFLRHRLAMILEKNPWLTSRLVKKKITILTHKFIVQRISQIDLRINAL